MTGESVKISEKELELGIGLIDRLTAEEFHPENYEDDYRIRVLAMLDEKSKGKEVTIAVPAKDKIDGEISLISGLTPGITRRAFNVDSGKSCG